MEWQSTWPRAARLADLDDVSGRPPSPVGPGPGLQLIELDLHLSNTGPQGPATPGSRPWQGASASPFHQPWQGPLEHPSESRRERQKEVASGSSSGCPLLTEGASRPSRSPWRSGPLTYMEGGRLIVHDLASRCQPDCVGFTPVRAQQASHVMGFARPVCVVRSISPNQSCCQLPAALPTSSAGRILYTGPVPQARGYVCTVVSAGGAR